MEWVETTGRTLEEAKDAALDQLGVDEADAEFQVLDEPRPGLFGRMRGEARVRARVQPTTPRPKDDRRDRRRKGRSRGGEGRTEDQQQADDQQAAQPRDAQESDEPEQDERAAREAGKPRRSPRGGGGREPQPAGLEAGGTGSTVPDGAGTGRAVLDRDDDEDERAVDVSMQMDDQELSLEEQGEIARRFLDGLLDAFDLDGTIAVRSTEDEALEVRIDGNDLGLLVGPRGTTLNALQELARTAVQRRSEARTARLHVDVAGYRERRREALERFARQQAEEVLASGEVRVLEPMAPADRKVIHDTINGIEGVATTSEGEEPRRRVVISPA